MSETQTDERPEQEEEVPGEQEQSEPNGPTESPAPGQPLPTPAERQAGDERVDRNA